MNSKQRRKERRKWRYRVEVKIDHRHSMGELNRWAIDNVVGEVKCEPFGVFHFTHEQDAVIFRMKF